VEVEGTRACLPVACTGLRLSEVSSERALKALGTGGGDGGFRYDWGFVFDFGFATVSGEEVEEDGDEGTYVENGEALKVGGGRGADVDDDDDVDDDVDDDDDDDDLVSDGRGIKKGCSVA
jgi:hypothetical protein